MRYDFVGSSDEKQDIDHSIDVGDVRIFLQRANGERPFEKADMPILGMWTLIVRDAAATKNLGLTLLEDGTCLMENVNGAYKGQYVYKDEVLSLTVPERRIRARWTLRWVDNNTFTCVERGTTLTFTRR